MAALAALAAPALVGLHARARPLVAQPVPARPAPELVLVDGRVFTADPDRPWAEAIAIRGDRIVAVGTTAEIARLAGPRTRRIALAGRTVVPGFDDAHAHVGLSAVRGIEVVVDPSPTPDPPLAAMLDSLGAAARHAPAGTWLTGTVGGAVLDDARATRAALDSVAPAHPVWLRGWSGHGSVLNTAGLRATGLLAADDPSGGWLVRDAAGTPTGRIDEYAIYGLDHRLAVARGDSLLGRAMRAYGEAALRLGITSVQDMAIQYDLASARAVARRGGAMRARHRVIRFPITDAAGGWRSSWRVSGADTALASTMHVSGVKWVLDGTPIERLALMRRPYADRPGWHGRANFPFDTLRAILRDALARGEQPHLHAVGDSTIALVIAAMRAEGPDSAWRRLRPRLEHADGLARDQLADVKALGLVVVQNPSHLAVPQVMTARWGAERLGAVDLLRTLVDSGVPLAIGSDGPREPGLNIMLATLHPNVPGEALTREQAVAAYTRGSAYAAFAERERGTLAPGMLADVAVLSHDVFTAPADVLPATTSVLTIVGGQIVHDALTVPARAPARAPGRAGRGRSGPSLAASARALPMSGVGRTFTADPPRHPPPQEVVPMPASTRSSVRLPSLGVALLGAALLAGACGGDKDLASDGADTGTGGSGAVAAPGATQDAAQDAPFAFTEADLDAYERGLQAEIDLVRAAQERASAATTPEARGEAMQAQWKEQTMPAAARAIGVAPERYARVRETVHDVLQTLDFQGRIEGPMQLDTTRATPEMRATLARDPFAGLPAASAEALRARLDRLAPLFARYVTLTAVGG